jgi:hypothetical protein
MVGVVVADLVVADLVADLVAGGVIADLVVAVLTASSCFALVGTGFLLVLHVRCVLEWIFQVFPILHLWRAGEPYLLGLQDRTFPTSTNRRHSCPSFCCLLPIGITTRTSQEPTAATISAATAATTAAT